MQRKNSNTIFKRIFIPLFVVMLLQSAVFYFVTVHGYVASTLNLSAADIMSERVVNRRNDISSQFTSRWTNTEFYSSALNTLYKQYRAQYDTPMYSDVTQKRQFLSEAAPALFSMLRGTAVNGVFVILTNSDTYQGVTDEPQKYYGLCIRDYDSISGYSDKEDLLITRCPSSLAATFGCPLDSSWDALYTFSSLDYAGDYFYKPLQAAYENPGVSADNFAYFCGAHSYSATDRQVVSYSVPLIDSDGEIYGVLGIELTTAYLSSLLPANELQEQNNGAYMLVNYTEGTNDFSIVASNGTLVQRVFGSDSVISMNPSKTIVDGSEIFEVEGRQGLSVSCSLSPITIYNRNTPFENEILALVGIEKTSSLFAASAQVQQSLIIITAIVLLAGMAAIFAASHLLTRPIKKLARSVRDMSPGDDAQLQHIDILEIDQLVDALETQSQKINQAKARTEFFSRMSHDMRTPMNAIIGFSSPEMAEGCDQAQLEKFLGKINGSGKYLLGLINEVLDITKIDSGKMTLENKPFSTTTFWNGSVPMIDELASQRGVRFIKEMHSVPDKYVVGDPQRLSQIFVNLLSNAVKFTPMQGTVTLSVSEHETVDNRLACRVCVRDTGIGMSREFQEKMYQPFSQEHANREGTGLGLSIAFQLVTLMGGTIDCKSEQGKGTEFTVELALPITDVGTAGAQPEGRFSERELSEILNGRRVLLCEDHPLNRQIAVRLLNKQKVNVEIAENGQMGVEMFTQSATGYYDAVLMDIRMPIMNGLDATAAIRVLERPDAKSTPIIAMTANAFKEDVDASSAAGMNAHLSKPIEPQKLYQTLAEYIADRDKAEKK